MTILCLNFPTLEWLAASDFRLQLQTPTNVMSSFQWVSTVLMRRIELMASKLITIYIVMEGKWKFQ